MSAYSDLKNHIHNTLEISKEQLREMVEQAVERVVERKLEVMFRKYWDETSRPNNDYSLYTMERVIDQVIREKGSRLWHESEDSFEDYIKKQVVRELLDGVNLKVEVAKTKKEATKTGDATLIIRKKKK